MIRNVLRCVVIGLLTFSWVQAEETQGTPGVDYPNFVTMPNSSFKCSDQEFIPGFYADLEAQCQAYHYCSEDGEETFLCPIGSIFNQAKLACDAWYNSNCSLASQLFSSNSGFLLENAMKNVPLLIKLRNRAKNKLSFRVPATDLLEKTSLYDGLELDQTGTKGLSISNDVSSEENTDTNEAQEEQLNEEESLDDILSRLEESIQNDQYADGIYYDNGDQNGGDSDRQTTLIFDSITEKYYVDPESSQDEWSQNFDQFGFYDPENFAYKYGLAMKDAEESRDFVESTSEPIDFNRLNMNHQEAAGDQLLKRRMDIERSFRRLRRKPIYTVVQQEELPVDIRDSAMDSEVTTESILVSDVSSEIPVEITTQTRRITNTRAPFEMIEDLSQLSMTPLNITEVPMTSEEFEDAIISELIAPKIDEHDLKIIGSSWDHEQENAGYTDDSSSDVQSDGFYRYVENESGEQFVYPEAYDAVSDAENLETDFGTSDQIDDAAEYYQDDERVYMESGKSDDTFVVIPDESEVEEFSEAFDTSGSSAESAFQDLSDKDANQDAAAASLNLNIPMNYESQDVYSVADSSHYRTALYSPSVEYGPRQYFEQEYFNPENEASSYPYGYSEEPYIADSPYMGSEHQYSFETKDPTSQYMYASPASYVCQKQGYLDCMYGSHNSYPYAGYYHNPYVNFPHDVSDVEESSESPISDELSYSSESYVIQSDPNINEKLEIDEHYEHPNSYRDQNQDASDYPDEFSLNTGTILENEAVNPETYYVLEDDDTTTSQVHPELVSEPSSHGNLGSVSDATGNQAETYYILDDDNEEKSMEDGPEVETFADVSVNEEVHEQQTFLQDSLNREESFSMKDSVSGLSSQMADTEDASQLEENSALGGNNAESDFGSTMDSRFTHVTNGESFATKDNRNGDILLDANEQFNTNDEASKVFISSHGNLPNMFLNNMAYSDPTNFGPHGFGSSFGQPVTGGSPTTFSFANGQKRTSDSESPNISKLSALQERIRSLKQGKFGAFKKYVSSSGSKH